MNLTTITSEHGEILGYKNIWFCFSFPLPDPSPLLDPLRLLLIIAAASSDQRTAYLFMNECTFYHMSSPVFLQLLSQRLRNSAGCSSRWSWTIFSFRIFSFAKKIQQLVIIQLVHLKTFENHVVTRLSNRSRILWSAVAKSFHNALHKKNGRGTRFPGVFINLQENKWVMDDGTPPPLMQCERWLAGVFRRPIPNAQVFFEEKQTATGASWKCDRRGEHHRSTAHSELSGRGVKAFVWKNSANGPWGIYWYV